MARKHVFEQEGECVSQPVLRREEGEMEICLVPSNEWLSTQSQLKHKAAVGDDEEGEEMRILLGLFDAWASRQDEAAGVIDDNAFNPPKRSAEKCKATKVAIQAYRIRTIKQANAELEWERRTIQQANAELEWERSNSRVSSLLYWLLVVVSVLRWMAFWHFTVLASSALSPSPVSFLDIAHQQGWSNETPAEANRNFPLKVPGSCIGLPDFIVRSTPGNSPSLNFVPVSFLDIAHQHGWSNGTSAEANQNFPLKDPGSRIGLPDFVARSTSGNSSDVASFSGAPINASVQLGHYGVCRTRFAASGTMCSVNNAAIHPPAKVQGDGSGRSSKPRKDLDRQIAAFALPQSLSGIAFGLLAVTCVVAVAAYLHVAPYSRMSVDSPVIVDSPLILVVRDPNGVVRYTWKEFVGFDIERHQLHHLYTEAEYKAERARVYSLAADLVLLPAMQELAAFEGRGNIIQQLCDSYWKQSPKKPKRGMCAKITDRNGKTKYKASTKQDGVAHYFSIYESVEMAVQASYIGLSYLPDQVHPDDRRKYVKEIICSIRWNQA
jgi:hypothetical protein